jgi:hypothetical protein
MHIKRNKIVRLADVIKNNDVFNILYLVLFGIVIKFIIKSYKHGFTQIIKIIVC